MATLRLRWRFFWSRRSRRRTVPSLMLALAALAGIVYLALPLDGQNQVRDGLLLAAQGVSSLGLRPVLALAAGVCVLLSLFLVFVPSYRRHDYLVTTPSLIPPVSVYLDAENQLSVAAIRPFTDFLIKHLDGRRADLLYFLDSSKTANGEKYKALYLSGFRPVDVPHDPTGKGPVKEAVDRELAMHAYERAILGPPDQEFIIVTGDGDFVPLVYRLAALGHHIQIWAAPMNSAYHVVESYLGITVIDLSQVISERKLDGQEDTPASTSTANAKNRPPSFTHTPASPSQPPPARVTLSEPGEAQLYYAIVETLAAREEAERKVRTDGDRNQRFHALIAGKYGPRMASVGYSGGKWLDYWLEQLIVLGVLSKVRGRSFPQRGPMHAENAARSLFAMSRAAARVAAQIGSGRENGMVRISEVSTALSTEGSALDADAAPLVSLVVSETGRRIAPVRYFVRSARALGLLEFEDVPDALDLIANPRLPAAPPAQTSAEEGVTSESTMPETEDRRDAQGATEDAAPEPAAGPDMDALPPPGTPDPLR